MLRLCACQFGLAHLDRTADYRVRVTTKFSPDHRKLEVKSEAQFHTSSGWVLGTDEALLQTLKTDIMGSVGRSTR